MAHIQTLISDIYSFVGNKSISQGGMTNEIVEQLAYEVGGRVWLQYGKVEQKPTLRLSQMGSKCPKALWHSIHTPGEAQPLPPWTQIKFTYGHVVEALAIALAKASGHEVTGEQDAVELDGVIGHRDCIIDGCVVDVKSAGSRSFLKYKDGSLAQNDSFGYLEQLDGYTTASLDDPLVRTRDRAYILAVNQELGHLALHEHIVRPDHIRERIAECKRVVEAIQPPSCTCKVIKHGESGNLALDMRASYSPWKFCCFPHLRTFIYSNGPKYLTKTVRKPDVTEVDRYGRHIYG